MDCPDGLAPQARNPPNTRILVDYAPAALIHPTLENTSVGSAQFRMIAVFNSAFSQN
jgi:hypothetical protein